MKKDNTNNSKKKPSRANLERFAGINLRSKIDRLYVHLERQHSSMLKLLDRISLEQYKVMNETGKFIKLRKKAVEKVPQKAVRNTLVSENHDLKLKHVLGEKIFIDALKEIGKPSLTNEIADHIKLSNPEVKKIAKNKKCLMRIMYNSAFNLNKSGQIKRTPVGEKSYEYSLLEWNKRQPQHRKTA